MREINVSEITNIVKDLLMEASCKIPSDVLESLKKAQTSEPKELPSNILSQIIANDELADQTKVPMCQDTGIVVCFLEVGRDVHFNGDIYQAINEGVRLAYSEGYLRKSVVKHPLERINTRDNTPAIIHTTITTGDKVKIMVAPKGAGSENMSAVKMMLPSSGAEGIEEFVLETIKKAGGKPCPPIVVGIGIGGDLELAAMMAKRALFCKIEAENPDPILRTLESKLLTDINNLNIGPMGFGGNTTCLAVKALAYPCHIASLPVAINIQCHAARHKSYLL